MVSVSTYVPLTNATPSRTASVVSASRSLRAKMPLIVALHMSFHLGRPRSHHRGALQRVATMRTHSGGANGAPRQPAGGRHRRRIGHRTGDLQAHDRGRRSRRGRRRQPRTPRANRGRGRMREKGARVAVVDVNGDAAEQVAKEIDGLAYEVDVTDYDALRAAVDDAT